MPHLTYLQERLTHSYTDGWQHLDAWGEAGMFHILSQSAPMYDEDDFYGENWSRYLRIKAPYGMPSDTVERILYSAFRRSCTCEHDCCGHVSTYVQNAKRIKRREWRVRVQYQVNC